eukprot:2855300-Prymnesium_polylepis.1
MTETHTKRFDSRGAADRAPPRPVDLAYFCGVLRPSLRRRCVYCQVLQSRGGRGRCHRQPLSID